MKIHHKKEVMAGPKENISSQLKCFYQLFFIRSKIHVGKWTCSKLFIFIHRKQITAIFKYIICYVPMDITFKKIQIEK